MTVPCQKTCTLTSMGMQPLHDVIVDPVLGLVRERWKKAFMDGCNDMMELISCSECSDCKAERDRRKRVLDANDRDSIPKDL